MLTLEHVCAGYGAREVVHDVSYTFESGRNYCIMGPNGCGKTTLLRAMSALIPHRGRIGLMGHEISRMKRRELAAHLAIMSQLHEVSFPYTVYDTVMMGRYRFSSGLSRRDGRDRASVERCLEITGLTQLRDRPVDQLSGGQRQRVFLAHALAQDPDLILLDEPTNHLDIRHQIELIDFLKEWSGDGKHSVIGVFHDVNLGLRFSEDVLFMKDGRLERAGKFSDCADRDFLTGLFGVDIAAYMTDTLQKWKEVRA